MTETHDSLPENDGSRLQHIRSQLQQMGLLSLPRLRIYFLAMTSGVLFFFVVFRLLPSAEVRVHPRKDSVNQTANIFLVLSGAHLPLSSNVRTIPLVPLDVHAYRSVAFDQITRRFSGKNAHAPMTIVNKTAEVYSFLKGTRLMNQAGVVFRLLDPVDVPPASEIDVRSRADELDFYGEPVGERGDVPAGLKWEIPGLAVEERQNVYGVNRVPAVGGVTRFRTVLEEGDLVTAQRMLEQNLVKTARQLIQEEIQLRNTKKHQRLEVLDYPELTTYSFTGFVLPVNFIGEPIVSVPVEGHVLYTQRAFDSQVILEFLQDELESHVREGRRLLADTLSYDRLVVHVIDYADNLEWIKLTVDLTGSEEYILDPLSPTGIYFGKETRSKIKGLPKKEAQRVVRNMQQVDNVDISLWPPWSKTLPTIPARISIVTE